MNLKIIIIFNTVGKCLYDIYNGCRNIEDTAEVVPKKVR